MGKLIFRVWSGDMWLDGGDANIKPVDPDSTDIELEASYPHKKLIICQWTGLIDKNKRRIYEGDIVISTIAEQQKIPTKVIRDKQLTGFIPFTIPTNFHDDDNYNGRCLSANYCEVIGNIYESKHLLEKDSK